MPDVKKWYHFIPTHKRKYALKRAGNKRASKIFHEYFLDNELLNLIEKETNETKIVIHYRCGTMKVITFYTMNSKVPAI